MRRENIAGLNVVFAGGKDRDGGGTGPLVVLLHGFGAPGDDLVPLWRALDLSSGEADEVRFAFPAAPIVVEAGWDGRAWWHIDVMAMQRAIASGNARMLAAEIPPGLAEARAQLTSFLDEIEKQLAPPKLVLGGFSQGAMLSLDVALHREKSLAGVALLSGTLLAEAEWVPRMAAHKSLPVFQSHGTHDPLLPFAAAETLRGHLTAAGCVVDWVPFRGQHEIPPQVLQQLALFLTRSLS